MSLSRWLQGILPARDDGSAAPALSAEWVFRRHGRDVVRILRRLLGPHTSEADLEDLTQQVFVAVHRDLHRFRGDSALTTWLYGIASRTVLMHLRSGRRRARAMEAYLQESTVHLRSAANLEQSLEHRRELEKVWACLEEMSPKKRVVFVLHEIEGLSGKDIAQALQITEGTVWTRLFHARRELNALLGKEQTP